MLLAIMERCSEGMKSMEGIDMKTLRDSKVGETVKIERLRGSGATRRRLMDMGLTRGADVYVRKVAPLGDPIELTVRGFELSIRKAEAADVEVA